MTQLVNVIEAMHQLRYDDEPPDLEFLIEAASTAVIDYLGAQADFVDDNGVITGTIPPEVKAATLIWISVMDKERSGEKVAENVDPKHGYGYPPLAVVRLLSQIRDPRFS